MKINQPISDDQSVNDQLENVMIMNRDHGSRQTRKPMTAVTQNAIYRLFQEIGE